jgi:hypothetical protein
MAKFDDDQEAQATVEKFDEESGSSKNLKIKEGQVTPIYILSKDYQKGYIHWVRAGGKVIKVACAGGEEGKGFAVDQCPVCSVILEMYKKAKENDDEKLKKKANSARAGFNAKLIAAQGELVIEKKNGKKIKTADFSEDVKVGILTLTEKNFTDFTALRGSEEFPFIKKMKDLRSRAILLDKRKREGSIFATTVFKPVAEITDPPEVEYDEEDFDLEEEFTVNKDDLKKAAKLLQRELDKDEDDEDEDDDDAEVEDDEEEDTDDEEDESDDESEEDDDEREDEEEEDSEDEDDDEEEGSKRKKKSSPKSGKKSSKEDDDDFLFDDGISDEKPLAKAEYKSIKGKAKGKKVVKDDFEDDIPEVKEKTKKGKSKKAAKFVAKKKGKR